MNTTVAVQLPNDALRRLHELAAQSGRSQAEYISDAVLEHLADEEAFRVAERRMRDLENGQSDSVPLDAVMKEYGLEN
ncbi:MAG: ribbon-helix-helix domain-containing protein [Gammaproteobacteria bacterium]|nr:ribbon-helix-helix domain-containing protein [Gammaproteobacteria bacterium]